MRRNQNYDRAGRMERRGGLRDILKVKLMDFFIDAD